jgi:NAD(P)-dependent dehydrogenase (short-subunit alcohol dehydrogenase family)
MFQSNLFQEKTALVTGGGSGIGLEIARQLLQLGAEVYIASRKPERLEQGMAELQALGTVHSYQLDIREPEQIVGLADLIAEKSGKLDILVNNAGGQFPSLAEDISPKGWQAVINTNLNGTWYMTQAMAKRFFFPQNQGIVINIVVNNFRGLPGMAHTGAARAGVSNLTQSLAVEWARAHQLRGAGYHPEQRPGKLSRRTGNGYRETHSDETPRQHRRSGRAGAFPRQPHGGVHDRRNYLYGRRSTALGRYLAI